MSDSRQHEADDHDGARHERGGFESQLNPGPQEGRHLGAEADGGIDGHHGPGRERGEGSELQLDIR